MKITVEVRAVNGGYRVDRSVSFDGETEGQLSEIYALLDRQETERRERIWTKGEHGYFTGSKSTGGSSGSGGGQKSLDKSAGSGIISDREVFGEAKNQKSEASKAPSLRISLQFFAEKGLENQRPSELRKGIRELNQRISEHEAKISAAQLSLGTLSGLEAKKQAGIIRHWQKEIDNFRESIDNRKNELKKRGEPFE